MEGQTMAMKSKYLAMKINGAPSVCEKKENEKFEKAGELGTT